MSSSIFLIESFPHMCFEGKWLQNRLRAEKNESRSFLVVDIQGHQRGDLCIVPSSSMFFQPRLSMSGLVEVSHLVMVMILATRF